MIIVKTRHSMISQSRRDGLILKADIEGHEYRVMDALVALPQRAARPCISPCTRAALNDPQAPAFGPPGDDGGDMGFIERLSAVGDVVMSASRSRRRAAIARKVRWKKRPKNLRWRCARRAKRYSAASASSESWKSFTARSAE